MLSTVMAAQTNIPVGTIIPVVLNSSLAAKKSRPGQTVSARVAQDVPLYNGAAAVGSAYSIHSKQEVTCTCSFP